MAAATFDVTRARAETPGCETVLHFNNAGASLMPRAVLDAQVEHLQLEAEIGGYEAAARAKPAIERAYDAIAEMLNCSRDEVALVENATVAWDMAFHSFDFQPGDRILTAEAEYASNYIAFLKVAKARGVEIAVVPSDNAGALSVAALETMIDARTKLIAVTHVPTNGGLVNPAAEIGRVAQAAGVPFLLDACQSVGQLPLDVEALGCDLLSATGRKHLRGPRGSGFLYVRKNLIEKLEPPFLDLHSAKWVAQDRYEIRADARRFENWEFNYAAVIGLGVAVDYAMDWGPAGDRHADRPPGRATARRIGRGSRLRRARHRPATLQSGDLHARRTGAGRDRGAAAASGDQHLDLDPAVDLDRHGKARPRGHGPRLGALLQHRGGGGALLRSGRGAARRLKRFARARLGQHLT